MFPTLPPFIATHDDAGVHALNHTAHTVHNPCAHPCCYLLRPSAAGHTLYLGLLARAHHDPVHDLVIHLVRMLEFNGIEGWGDTDLQVVLYVLPRLLTHKAGQHVGGAACKLQQLAGCGAVRHELRNAIKPTGSLPQQLALLEGPRGEHAHLERRCDLEERFIGLYCRRIGVQRLPAPHGEGLGHAGADGQLHKAQAMCATPYRFRQG
mmetsp:Transcript_14056/g.30430  ORF Transcript_14056/g.30430 Transcript_14056/m.30430 type:complete len:208 (+) Transcript_14056:555-1178(+)